MRKIIPGLLAVALCTLAFDASARFVSVDPVQANPNTGANFNRYHYANNNPYTFTDPDGREVRYQYGGGVSVDDGKNFMIRVVMSPTAHGEVMRLEQSKDVYTIRIDDRATNWYDADSRTVYVDPNETLTIASSGEQQGGEINGAHEISHAAQHDRVGDDAFSKSLERPITPEGSGVSPEENRATEVEKEVGKDLGLPTREHYRDVQR